ncbi:MAG TPA: HAD family hydrolase [Caulobacteraceae bacterium]|jgi:D-glycero-D-manno-heptose 1,7-bisphosphate phosphatase|nr:HAD family hydrolase [Caulobacteraceae bacterium]
MTTKDQPLRGAVIFDRDGVLNVNVGYAHRPDQIAWIEDAAAAVKAVNDAGLFAFVATNQSGVARGYYSEADVEALHAWMAAELASLGARIDAFVYCADHPDQASDRRKPGPGMILELMARFPVDPARTVMVGDFDTDIQAARAAGIAGVKFEGGSLMAFLAPVLEHIAALP